MPIDIAKLRSAEVITDPARAYEVMAAKLLERTAGPMGRQGVTSVSLSKEGTLEVRKASMLGMALGGREGAPAIPGPEEIRRLAEARHLKWDDEYLERVRMVWASDQRVDGHGDIVLNGDGNMDFSEFAKSGTMPFSHNSHTLGVGKWIAEGVVERTSPDYQGPATWALGLHGLAKTDPEADRVWRHVDAGLLPAVSIGFVARKVIDIKDEAERIELGLGRWGYILGDNLLLEISPTLIGANPGALQIWQNAKSKNLLREDDFPYLRELQRRSITRGQGDTETFRERDRELRAIATALFPKLAWKEHEALDEPIEEVKDAAFRRATPPAEEAPVVVVRTATCEKCGGDKKEDLAGEVKSLRALVEAQAAELATLKQSFAEGIVSLSAILNDVRDQVENIASGKSGAAGPVEEEGESLPGNKGAAPAPDAAPKRGEEVTPLKSSVGEMFSKKLMERARK